jgi:hypothetical protein
MYADLELIFVLSRQKVDQSDIVSTQCRVVVFPRSFNRLSLSISTQWRELVSPRSFIRLRLSISKSEPTA